MAEGKGQKDLCEAGECSEMLLVMFSFDSAINYMCSVISRTSQILAILH